MCNIVLSRLLHHHVRSQPKDLNQDCLKNIFGGVEKYEPEVQVDGELDLDLTVHDEDVHEEIALKPSREFSDTNTSNSQILDKPCDE